MRVLMVSSLWPPHVMGGAELYASALAERLRSAGHVVGVVTMGVPGPDVVAEVPACPYRLDEFATQSAATRAVFHASDVYRPSTTSVLTRALEKFSPDVVHTHAVQGLSSAALEVPSRRGAAHVHTLHDYWLLCQRTTMVARDGTACDDPCRSCAAVSWARNAIVSRHPPKVVIAISDEVARQHDRLAWTRGRTRVRASPGGVVARAAGAPARADRLRVPGSAEPREGGPRAARRVPGRRPRRCTTAHRRRGSRSIRVAGARQPGCRVHRLARRRGQGRVPRRPRLPGRPVGVEGAGRPRGERGPGALRPRHRGRASAGSRSSCPSRPAP